MAKTIRFGDLVRGSGRPQVVTLWVEPKKDKNFSKAVDENRVLTVLTDPGSHRKEYGRIGFHQQEGAIYLVFSKELPPPDSIERVVGINYELTEEKPVTDPVTKEFWEEVAQKAKADKQKRVHQVEKELEKDKAEAISERAPAAPPHPPAIVKPKLKTFEVTMRRLATIEERYRIKAETEEEAKAGALKEVKAKKFTIKRADMSVEVIGVKEEEK